MKACLLQSQCTVPENTSRLQDNFGCVVIGLGLLALRAGRGNLVLDREGPLWEFTIDAAADGVPEPDCLHSLS